MGNELEQAVELLGIAPPPADLEMQIESLYAAAPNTDKEYFAEIYEAMFVILNKRPAA